MGASDGFLTLLQDLLSGLGLLSVRRMFGGAGLFANGMMFAIVIDDVLYLKADNKTRGAFEAEGMSPFSYERNGRPVELSYWRAPERLLDDGEELCAWAWRARDVAGRKPPKAKSRTKAKMRTSSGKRRTAP